MVKKLHLIKFFLFLISFLLVFKVRLYCKIIDGIAAIVNNDIITISELNEKLKPYKEKIQLSSLTPQEKRKELLKIKNKLLDKLIDDRLIEQFGKKLGYKVTDKDVDNLIQNILKKNDITLEQLKETLKANNISYKAYRENLKREILVARVINSYVRRNIKIPKEEIEKYVKTHFQINNDVEYHIKQILFLKRNLPKDKEKIKKVLEILKKNKNISFSELAKKYSEGPFRDQGGDLGFFKKEELLPEIAKQIANMKVGQVKEIKTRLGIHIIKLVDIKNKNQKISLLMKKAEEQLKSKMFDKKLKEWINQLRQEALIIKKI